jgi:hypothetical protein
VLQGPSAISSRRDTGNIGARQELGRNSSEDIPEEDLVVGPHEDFYGIFSLARSVDEVNSRV